MDSVGVIGVVLTFLVGLGTAIFSFTRTRKPSAGSVKPAAELAEAAKREAQAKVEAVTKLAKERQAKAEEKAVNAAREKSRVTSLADYLNRKRGG